MSEQKTKPVLDEQTLAKLLEAAYVLQEHNRELRELELSMELERNRMEAEQLVSTAQNLQAAIPKSSPPPPPADYSATLGKIVETQHHIQVQHLDLENALKLVAARVVEIGRATGAAIGIVNGKTVRYRAVAGHSGPVLGSAVATEQSMIVPCLRSGQVFRCADATAEIFLHADECRQRGIQSLIAVPVFHNGVVAGGLELYYDSPKAFTEQDVHTCQLMAGLVTEVLARDEEAASKKSLASERTAMLKAIEKLQPNLAALVEKPPAKTAAAGLPAPVAARPFSCRKCGHRLKTEEQFCGQCGTPRASDYEPPSLQSKVASLWHMQESQKRESAVQSAKPQSAIDQAPMVTRTLQPESPLPNSLKQAVPDLFADADLELSDIDQMPEFSTLGEPTFGEKLEGRGTQDEIAGVEDEHEEVHTDADEVSIEPPDTSQALANTKLTHLADWSSAASARVFLEQLASSKRPAGLLRIWNTRRGDIYLAVAVILVACVIRWGIWSDHSVRATTATPAANAAQRKPAPDAGLSLFDRVLIGLGLAEPPDAPEDKGSPGVQVWVDTRTGLYYCPGTDLYGKSPKGKLTTQREAQLDQFEPAYRKACN